MQEKNTDPLSTSIDSSTMKHITKITTESFKKIAPFWPLQNFIAVNPLQGFEDLPIEEAMSLGISYFEQTKIPKEIENINRETIKWLQAYFDNSQATIQMPLKKEGLYLGWKKLVIYDYQLHHNNKEKKGWLESLPDSPSEAIFECFSLINITKEFQQEFLTLLLTTLPGWASYIKYRTEWKKPYCKYPNPVTQSEYLAIRIIITYLLWPEAKTLLEWSKNQFEKNQNKTNILKKLEKTETHYRLPLLQKLVAQPLLKRCMPEAQLVFCIDTRSEQFRKCLESTGNYETFSFAGFFGIPAEIKNPFTHESYTSCPVLLFPKHKITQTANSDQGFLNEKKSYTRLTKLNQAYQSSKYTFTTPFVLAEFLGIISGLWMGLLSAAPQIAYRLKKAVNTRFFNTQSLEPSLKTLTFKEQYTYAENILKIIGLTDNFAPIVIFCGHKSATQNNAYASALNCGACGGHEGGNNAKILAAILNQPKIKTELHKNGINIPENTLFLAAEHITTTDEVVLYNPYNFKGIKKLQTDLEKARSINSFDRLKKMEEKTKLSNASSLTLLRSKDWSQVRPEWGLALNASFIIAPRYITSSLNLESRSFLHSYDYTQDKNGNSLKIILTGPMVVAQWINMQYLFSTINNIAYGSGSKITQNITGRMGIIQGNASDLMTGLPLQSVYKNDLEAYHEPQRLMTVIYATRKMVDKILQTEQLLQKLFKNEWIQMVVIEPNNHKIYWLQKDFTWQ